MVSARLCGHDESAPTPDEVLAASTEVFVRLCQQNGERKLHTVARKF
ncbi:hypothetical protein [uncultured Prevotella sp.]|nr:hypothetical protein [uncultured Prevotella sp.]